LDNLIIDTKLNYICAIDYIFTMD